MADHLPEYHLPAYLGSLKALADETRLRIVRVLESGPFNVGELVSILDMGQSRVSRHLKILHDAGLLSARRQGAWVYYDLSERWRGSARDDRAPRRFLRVLGRELAALGGDRLSADRRGIDACLERRRERASRFFQRVASSWDRQRDSVQGRPEHLDQLTDALGRPGTVVDLGTGTGVLLERLSACADTVIGIDASPEMLEEARRSIAAHRLENVQLRLGALEHLPIPDRHADAMVAHMVLHHVASPLAALREARRGLKPGGRFVLADLAAHDEESYRDELGDLWLGFDSADLAGWLDEAGFGVDELTELPGEADRPGLLLVRAHSLVPSTEEELTTSD